MALSDRLSKHKGSPVPDSKDLQRILNLPVRQEVDGLTVAQKWTEIFRKPDWECDCKERWGRCIKTFNKVQGEAFEEFERVGGLYAAIGVGHGKTGISIFLPMVRPEIRTALLLIPAYVRDQFLNQDFHMWSAHFYTPNLYGGKFDPELPTLHVMSYSELSLPKNSDVLKRISPDLVIGDEGHCLKDPKRPRFLRLKRQDELKPDTKYAFMSGTLMTNSIKNSAHLAYFALGEGTPYPIQYHTLDHWSAAMDPLPVNCPPGKLRVFGENPRKGFGDRLLATPGVVTTKEASIDCSLLINARGITLPRDLYLTLQESLKTWKRPDGEELVEAKDLAFLERQLSLGFYYRQIFPHGEPEPLIREWLEIRRNYNSEIRDALKSGREHMDSPELLKRAAINYEGNLSGPKWKSQYLKDWMAIENQVVPETETCWLSDFAIEDCSKWLEENVGIVWVEFLEFGRRLSRQSRKIYYGGGKKASRMVRAEKGNRPVILSIDAHGTGKNLQAFNQQLVTTPPSNGGTWEQLLGRTWRQGQTADVVTADVYLHTDAYRKALASARRDNEAAEDIEKKPLALMCATYNLTGKPLTGKE